MAKITDRLINKYLKGETTPQEEISVRHYFISDAVKEEHMYLTPYFKCKEKFISKSVSIESDFIIDLANRETKKRVIKLKKITSYAAILLILISVGIKARKQHELVIQKKKVEQAEKNAEYGLLLLSGKMYKGSQFFTLKSNNNEIQNK
jgi:hypothetical protein